MTTTSAPAAATRVAQQRPAGVAEVAGERYAARCALSAAQEDARRAEDVAGIEERGTHPGGDFERLVHSRQCGRNRSRCGAHRASV